MLVDIHDGDHEPMTYHGKTFTSKVTLQEVCQVTSVFGVYAPFLVNKKCYGWDLILGFGKSVTGSRSLQPVLSRR